LADFGWNGQPFLHALHIDYSSLNQMHYLEVSILAFIGLQGLPAQTVQAGISFVTTEYAPTTVPSPIVIPGPTKTPAASHALDPTWIGFEYRGKRGSE
jgi:hypothetical protein